MTIQRSADINVTPLIDVMLVLLIVFMVVTPMSHRALDTQLPTPPSEGTPQPSSRTPVVEIDADGCGLVGEPHGTPAMLESRLRDVIATRQDKTVFVRATASVSYGAVVSGLDAVRGAGAERIGLLGREALERRD
jgi:biopolymer transport protein TolR